MNSGHLRRIKNSVFYVVILLVFCYTAQAQYDFIARAPTGERIKVLWEYCAENRISDKDPDKTSAFFDDLSRIADSLKDKQLQAYVQYFKHCSLVLFSRDYQIHFVTNDYKTVVGLFSAARNKALQAGYRDIAASAEHYIGQVYFRANVYGQAFEHLIKADGMMRTMGYQNIPGVSVYLYELGLNYYLFEDYEKALSCFLEAVRYPVYQDRIEMNTLNAIGLVYAKKKDYGNAIAYYHLTLARAREYKDTAWIGIASGNMGSVFLAKGDNKQAINYYRFNYAINAKNNVANDAALSALYMAKAFIRGGNADSALLFLNTGYNMRTLIKNDQAQWLHFYKTYYEAAIEVNKRKGNFALALQLSDSLLVLHDSSKNLLDAKILSRAVQKTEAEKNFAELQLMESRKNVNQLQFLLVIAALLIFIIGFLVIFKVYRLRKSEQAQMAEKEKQLLSLEKLRAEENLSHASEQLETYLATIREKNEYILLMDAEMKRLKEITASKTDDKTVPPVVDSLLAKPILTDDDWRHFRNLFEQVYPGFTSNLMEKFPHLSPAENRLLIMSRLNLSPREMANMLGISVDAIRKSKNRLRKKLNLAEEVELNEIIRGM